jgi:hypothetical protein
MISGRHILEGRGYVLTGGVAAQDLGYEGHEGRNVIAVVRPISRRRPKTMPGWARGWYGTAVVAPDGASGLTIRPAHGFWTWLDEWQVLVEGNDPIGTFRRSPRSGPTFRECTCGQRPRECQCGGRHGKLRTSAGVCRVVDAADHELARITPRWFDTGLGPEYPRERLARWGRGATTLNYEVVEPSPGFDWHRHGLLVALAAWTGGFGRNAPDRTRRHFVE